MTSQRKITLVDMTSREKRSMAIRLVGRDVMVSCGKEFISDVFSSKPVFLEAPRVEWTDVPLPPL